MNISSYIDHTILRQDCKLADLQRVCEEAMQYGFAAVCIPPYFVRKAKEMLRFSEVRVATVIGFPFGYSVVEGKISEVVRAMDEGADELDMVINLIALKNSDWHYLDHEIGEILPMVHRRQKKIKIIIESGLLSDSEIIRCCKLYGSAGADFLKTSTGYAEKGATVEAVRLMKANLPDSIRIKASGGIRTYIFAKELIEAGASRIGCSSSVAIVSGAPAVDKSSY